MLVVSLEHLVLVQVLVDSAKPTQADHLANLPRLEEEYLVREFRRLAVLQRHPADLMVVLVVVIQVGESLVLIIQRNRLAFSAPPVPPLLNRIQAFLAQVTNRGLALQTRPLALVAAMLEDYLLVISNPRKNPTSFSTV